MKQLLLDIQQIPFDGELKFASFDITDMYTDVPSKKVREIIHDVFIKNNVDQRIKKEILDICVVIIQQNYYFFFENCYIHNDGLAMGASTSSILWNCTNST